MRWRRKNSERQRRTASPFPSRALPLSLPSFFLLDELFELLLLRQKRRIGDRDVIYPSSSSTSSSLLCNHDEYTLVKSITAFILSEQMPNQWQRCLLPFHFENWSSISYFSTWRETLFDNEKHNGWCVFKIDVHFLLWPVSVLSFSSFRKKTAMRARNLMMMMMMFEASAVKRCLWLDFKLTAAFWSD